MKTRAEVISAVQQAHDYATSAIDLSGCCYGAPHWDGPFVDTPCGYYFFLAGLVAKLGYARILEIGSHFGGSIFSMARAVEHCGMASSAEIVTIDCVDLNSDAFRANPLVRRMIGDCFDSDLASQVRLSFSAPIDLMFIDAVHDYETTRRCVDLYVPLVAPELVILDDIRINDAMMAVWRGLSAEHGDNAVDVTEASCRGSAEGMGLLIFG